MIEAQRERSELRILILIENLASPATTPKALARACAQSKSQAQTGTFTQRHRMTSPGARAPAETASVASLRSAAARNLGLAGSDKAVKTFIPGAALPVMLKATEKSTQPAAQMSSPSVAPLFFLPTPTEKTLGIAEPGAPRIAAAVGGLLPTRIVPSVMPPRDVADDAANESMPALRESKGMVSATPNAVTGDAPTLRSRMRRSFVDAALRTSKSLAAVLVGSVYCRRSPGRCVVTGASLVAVPPELVAVSVKVIAAWTLAMVCEPVPVPEVKVVSPFTSMPPGSTVSVSTCPVTVHDSFTDPPVATELGLAVKAMISALPTAGFTVTARVAVVVPPLPVAVSLYVVVAAGGPATEFAHW